MSLGPAGGPHRLLPHPAVPVTAIDDVAVRLARIGDALILEYALVGDLAQLQLPEPRPPVRSDGLWRHTCFEAFIGRESSTEYWEYNFSPSGAWAAYHFTGYREGMAPLMKGTAPAISSAVEARRLDMEVTLDLTFLARGAADLEVRLGLSAVIEDKSHGLSYWALAHPAEKPDFHHTAGRVLALGPAALG
jgi:hypothetical protein